MELIPLYSNEVITKRIEEISKIIKQDPVFSQENFLCVCVLKGAYMFFSEITKRLGDNIECAFIRLSSYGDKLISDGQVTQIGELVETVKNKNVLIVEDIIDSGHTLSYLVNLLAYKGAAIIRTVALIDKPESRKTAIKADFTAFTIQNDSFIVGFGLDYKEKYRNLDSLYKLCTLN